MKDFYENLILHAFLINSSRNLEKSCLSNRVCYASGIGFQCHDLDVLGLFTLPISRSLLYVFFFFLKINISRFPRVLVLTHVYTEYKKRLASICESEGSTRSN
jgi:hypothetical protein